MYTVNQLESIKNDELIAICRDMKCKRYSKLNKKDLVKMIMDVQSNTIDIDTIDTIDTNITNTIDKEKLTFTYKEKQHDDTYEFLGELVLKNDVDEVELFCQKYIADKKKEFSDSTIKKFLASIRNCLKNDNEYLSQFFSEDLLNGDLVHIAYGYLKLDKEDYENLQKKDIQNRNEKIDDKVELSGETIIEYLTKSVQYLNQRENYKLVICAICALTARRFIEVFRLIQDFDIDEKFTLTINTNQLAKTKNDKNDLLTCYCLCDSEMVFNALCWLRNESPLKIINEDLKDVSNEEINNKYKTTINDCVKKNYDFLPTPSNKTTLSIHNLRSVSVCLMVQLFTRETNDVDLFLSKCLGHSGNSAKDFYKSYYVPSKSEYYRGYLLDNTIDVIEFVESIDGEGETIDVSETVDGESIDVSETVDGEGELIDVSESIIIGGDEKMIDFKITESQYEMIEKLGGLDKVLTLAIIDTYKTGDIEIKTINNTIENTVNDESIDTNKNTVKNDEFGGYRQYHKIKDCIDKIKFYNAIKQNDEDKLMLTSTIIYQYTGVRTDTISQFRNETEYGDFDAYNNQFNFIYRQNANKDVKKILSEDFVS